MDRIGLDTERIVSIGKWRFVFRQIVVEHIYSWFHIQQREYIR